MAAARRRNLLRGRRRLEDEGEEDDLDVGNESGSEASALTDADIQSDVDESDLSDTDDRKSLQPENNQVRGENHTEVNKNSPVKDAKKVDVALPPPAIETTTAPAFHATADTLVMLNGFTPDEKGDSQEIVEFEEAPPPAPDPQQHVQPEHSAKGAGEMNHETIYQRRAREREEYKAKKEMDPAFVPSRGGFFMHDQRDNNYDQSRIASLARGRGRGGNFPVHARLPFRSGNPSTEASIGRWDHDLHETVNKPTLSQAQKPSSIQQSQPISAGPRSERLSALSKTISVGTVMIRCSLPSSERPAKFLKMTVRQHTRLPDLRPPLRRDKPVRVALPEFGPRYVFPSAERSFIFIPRAQRPNQQATRGRLRSVFSSSGSRRTSAYGGSVYEPSIAMSRRSSAAPDAMLLPGANTLPGSITAAAPDMGRPVVRLPSNAHLYQALSTGSAQYPQLDLPMRSAESVASQLPMHQPRPQKTVSLATIESPNRAPLHAPQQQEQQPFYHQVPAHMTNQIASDRADGMFGSQFSMPDQLSTSSAPITVTEDAINAEPFQPSHMSQQVLYSTPYAATQPLYYYNMPPDGQTDQYPTDNMSSPVYVQQGPYLVPMFGPPPISADEAASMSQAGMYAQERNGMVYYYDSAQLGPEGGGENSMGYSVPGASGMVTPGPEGYYYAQGAPGMVYYPPQ